MFLAKRGASMRGGVLRPIPHGDTAVAPVHVTTAGPIHSAWQVVVRPLQGWESRAMSTLSMRRTKSNHGTGAINSTRAGATRCSSKKARVRSSDSPARQTMRRRESGPSRSNSTHASRSSRCRRRPQPPHARPSRPRQSRRNLRGRSRLTSRPMRLQRRRKSESHDRRQERIRRGQECPLLALWLQQAEAANSGWLRESPQHWASH